MAYTYLTTSDLFCSNCMLFCRHAVSDFRIEDKCFGKDNLCKRLH